jgi:hypothetical protein
MITSIDLDKLCSNMEVDASDGESRHAEESVQAKPVP